MFKKRTNPEALQRAIDVCRSEREKSVSRGETRQRADEQSLTALMARERRAGGLGANFPIPDFQNEPVPYPFKF